MIKEEVFRRSAPEKPSRGALMTRVPLTLVFTGAQVWAANELAELDLSDWELCSLVLVLAAAFIAALDAWKEIWVLFRPDIRHSPKDCGEDSGH